MNYPQDINKLLERALHRNEKTYRRHINDYLTTPYSMEREYSMNALESTALKYYLISAKLFGDQFAEGMNQISQDSMNALDRLRGFSSLQKGEVNHGS